MMKSYISGNIRRIIYESNSGPYKVGLFRVKDTNYSDYEEYIGKVIGFTGSFTASQVSDCLSSSAIRSLSCCSASSLSSTEWLA